jgi:hypothetical protein
LAPSNRRRKNPIGCSKRSYSRRKDIRNRNLRSTGSRILDSRRRRSLCRSHRRGIRRRNRRRNRQRGNRRRHGTRRRRHRGNRRRRRPDSRPQAACLRRDGMFRRALYRKYRMCRD